MSKVSFSTWCGSLRLVQRHHEIETTVDVRRVERDDIGEHVQIAVTIEKHGTKRTTSQHGSLTLCPKDVPFLLTALTKLHPPYDQGHKPWSEHEREDRAFYGLPEDAR